MKRNIKYIAACLALLIIGGVVAGFTFSGGALKAEMDSTPAEEMRPPQVDEIQGYRNWSLVNPQPVYISSKLDIMCAMPTKKDREDEARNPHLRKLINVYVNDLGQQAMTTELKPKFPVGSVIVKEKFSSKEKDAPELLTVMVKRESGFNPAVGDWEFMAVNGAGTKIDARGRLESCQSCHVLMKEGDFVSRNYLPYELRRKLR
ncbi:MAG: cytochrome P460 family protein [Pyrinomonadaceae bacterium]|nr:cytochrome P460 family protein [Pyrinomonadaceae bacterium]